MKKLYTFFVLVILGLTCFGQTNYPTRDSIHIFWQPDLKITDKDYIGSITPTYIAHMDKFNYSAIASVGIWHVLDIPKRGKDMYSKFEKVYIAPAFERTTSATRTNDSLQIAMQNLYFDMGEFWARWARKQFVSLKDSTNSTGIQAIMYTTIIQKMMKLYDGMSATYTDDVIIKKKEGSFIYWKNLIDAGLEGTKEWSTTPEECYRLMNGKPIEKGYKKAKKLIGPMPDKK